MSQQKLRPLSLPRQSLHGCNLLQTTSEKSSNAVKPRLTFWLVVLDRPMSIISDNSFYNLLDFQGYPRLPAFLVIVQKSQKLPCLTVSPRCIAYERESVVSTPALHNLALLCLMLKAPPAPTHTNVLFPFSHPGITGS